MALPSADAITRTEASALDISPIIGEVTQIFAFMTSLNISANQNSHNGAMAL